MRVCAHFCIRKCGTIYRAELDRASDYGSEGREFESSPARHKKIQPKRVGFFYIPLPEDLNPFLRRGKGFVEAAEPPSGSDCGVTSKAIFSGHRQGRSKKCRRSASSPARHKKQGFLRDPCFLFYQLDIPLLICYNFKETTLCHKELIHCNQPSLYPLLFY